MRTRETHTHRQIQRSILFFLDCVFGRPAMAYLLDHKQMVSLRGKEYTFNLEGELPDWRDEPSRQLYIDSFILFALPVDSDTVRKYRLQGMRTVLEHLTWNRFQWFYSAMFSIKVDHVMWNQICKFYPLRQEK